jgi:hypothetical protein
VSVPDAAITFSPTATTASNTFSAVDGWHSTVPVGLGGNTFVAGQSLYAGAQISGGLNPVTWTADFSSTAAGVSINWQWSAAVYTRFSSDNAALGVKPVDASSVSQYANSDHAGTPEAFKCFVIGGARGGGGSNFTGSYSATKSVTPDLSAPPVANRPAAQGASLSGYVNEYLWSDNSYMGGLSGVVIGLYRDGALVASTSTDVNGRFEFTGLAAGTYTLVASQLPDTDAFDSAAAGTVGGATDGEAVDGHTIGGIVLGDNQSGVDYTFNAIFMQPN